MINREYDMSRMEVILKLFDIITHKYGPNHVIDMLNDAIDILQPYAEKEKEKTHA